MLLYRYRKIENALKEIENGTFYLAPSNELNDPLESFLQVYWQGDIQAWEGLLRNYIYSLYIALKCYYSKGDIFDPIVQRFLIKHNFIYYKIDVELYKKLGDAFFQNSFVKRVLEYCVNLNSGNRISKAELTVLLTFTHEIALKICANILTKINYISEKDKIHSFLKNCDQNLTSHFEKLLETIKCIGDNNISIQNKEIIKRVFFSSAKDGLTDVIEQNYCLSFSSSPAEDNQQINWISVHCDFPRNYVDILTEMIYPNSYVACFSKCNDNSSMWGNYADNHKGVCLIYEGGKNNILNLHSDNLNFDLNLPIKPILYEGEHIERNFFNSLGLFTYDQIKLWLTGTDGSLSHIYDEYTGQNREKWEKSYLEDCDNKDFKKLKEWSNEEEYRIAFSDRYNQLFACKSINQRCFKFNYSSLKGIIFGIRTTYKDKKQIISLLSKHKNEIDDFKFFQSEYDELNKKIFIREKFWKLK